MAIRPRNGRMRIIVSPLGRKLARCIWNPRGIFATRMRVFSRRLYRSSAKIGGSLESEVTGGDQRFRGCGFHGRPSGSLSIVEQSFTEVGMGRGREAGAFLLEEKNSSRRKYPIKSSAMRGMPKTNVSKPVQCGLMHFCDLLGTCFNLHESFLYSYVGSGARQLLGDSRISKRMYQAATQRQAQ